MKNKDLIVWNFIAEKLQNKTSCYLLVIAESKGSSPGRKGFKMAVCADGDLRGSIGGGSMEHRLVEHCKTLLQKNEQPVFLKKEIHHGDSESPSGMICSGNQTIAFIPIGRSSLNLVHDIQSVIQDKKHCQVVYSNKGISLEENLKDKKLPPPFSAVDDQWAFVEVPGKLHEVFIVGSGHVGLALSQLLSLLDFRVTIFDDRDRVNTFVDNYFAHEKKIISYEEIENYIPEGQNNMAVIITQFHTSDALVLSKLIHKKLGYLGMMGSQSKVKTIFNQLEDKGIRRELLQQVHSPIGIEIKSQTPEEIAVSIAAELIMVKNGGVGSKFEDLEI